MSMHQKKCMGSNNYLKLDFLMLQTNDLHTSLIPHETLCLDILTGLLFHMYEDRSWFKNDYETLEARLSLVLSSFLDQFASISNQAYRDSLSEAMNFCLERIIKLQNNKVNKNKVRIFNSNNLSISIFYWVK
jgi:hypothetical protein